jgi:DNA-binding response OmpR family regulator
MNTDKILKGKRVLVVDDDEDIVQLLSDLLAICIVHRACDFITAKYLLEQNHYDVAVLDIMGVDGYELLTVANSHGIPAVMLTAHALRAESLVKSIQGGAHAYLPKYKMVDIGSYLANVIQAQQNRKSKCGIWYTELKADFDREFGKDWQAQKWQFWDEFDRLFVFPKEELELVL